MVALVDDRIVGHILFSPATIEGEKEIVVGMGLAPMAVLPELQRQGIGSELVKNGIERLKKIQCPFVIVLGHPEYYPRFGFERASLYKISSQWDGIPDEAFMIIAFDRGTIPEAGGIAWYRSEFDEAM